jgi:hypothetical protein
MDAMKDGTVFMAEVIAVDNMALENCTITNDDIVDTANAGVPPSGETDLSANADDTPENADDKPENADNKPPSCRERRWAKCMFFLTIVAFICVVASMGVVKVMGGASSDRLVTVANDEVTDDPLGKVSDDPPEDPTVRKSNVDQVIAYMVNTSVSDLTALATIGSPQNRAATWMAEQDAANTAVPAGNATALEGYNYVVRYVMAVFYYSTGGDDWNVQYFFMTIAPVCDWNNARIDGPNAYRRGIICDKETDLVFGLDYGK